MRDLFCLKQALQVLTAVVVMLVTCPAMAETPGIEAEVLLLALPSTTKYIPGKTDLDRYSSVISVEGLRGEWVSFQILIRPGYNVSRLEDVDVSFTRLPFLTDGRVAIDASAFRFYRQWFFDIQENSGAGTDVRKYRRDPGLYPDPLIPFKDPFMPGNVPVGAPFTLELDPGYALIWVDLLIPRDAKPGSYGDSIDIKWRAYDSIGNYVYAEHYDVHLSLQVWDLDMPQERSLGTSFGMNEQILRRYHGGPDPDAASEDYDTIIQNYQKVLHEHRIDLTYQKGPLEFEFDDDGELLPVDWTAYDAYLQPRIDGTYFGDTVGVARFASGMFEPGAGTGTMTDEQYKAAARAYVEHLHEKGWLQRMWTYSAGAPWLDGGEETWAGVVREAGLLQQASELWKGRVMVESPIYPGSEDVIGIWCPGTTMYDKWFWADLDYAGRGDYDEHIANGGELWFSSSNANFPPYAGYDIDTAIGYEPRIMKWGAWYEKATGFLYWNTNYWTDAGPWVEWQSIDTFGEMFARNGDGFLLYPGDSNGYHVDKNGNPIPSGVPDWLSINGPITSFRMKQIRDGLEDWELFIMAEKAGLGEWLRTEIERVYTKFGTFHQVDCSKEYSYCPSKGDPWNVSERVLLDVRKRVASKLQFTLHPDKYNDPDDKVQPPEEPDDDEPMDGDYYEPWPLDTIEPVDVTDAAVDVTDAAWEDAKDTWGDTKDAEIPVDAKTDGSKPSGKSGCSASGSSSLPGAILLALLSGLLLIRRRNRA